LRTLRHAAISLLNNALRTGQAITFPGCDRPPHFCEAHHLRRWADGGDTKLTNLALLCDEHHRTVHQQDWLTAIVHGRAEFTPPRWLDLYQEPIRNTMHHPPDTGQAA
jgi:hypothetical protein